MICRFVLASLAAVSLGAVALSAPASANPWGGYAGPPPWARAWGWHHRRHRHWGGPPAFYGRPVGPPHGYANPHARPQAYQPVDEVVVQPGRWSKPILKTIRAGATRLATRTMRMAPSAAPAVVGSRTRKHQPRATASFGVPAPISWRMSSPRLCPATWIR